MIDNRQWPFSNILISHRHHLLFTPVAKNAHTTLKRLFVRLSGHPEADKLLQGDIHNNLTCRETGIRLADYPHEEANQFLLNGNYHHFAVMRSPLSRVVSGYISKFIVAPPSPATRGGPPAEIGPAIDWVYARMNRSPDYERSITFNDFVDYLAANHDDDLDTHFKSQSAYFRGQSIKLWFSMERLETLVHFLEEHTQQTVELEQAGSVQRKKSFFRKKHKEITLPSKMRTVRATPWEHELLTPRNTRILEGRFSEDMQRWEQGKSPLEFR